MNTNQIKTSLICILTMLNFKVFCQTSGMSGVIPNPFGAGILGTNNTSFGARAGAGLTNNTQDNTFVGFQAGVLNAAGNFNSFLGSEAGANNAKGDFNVYTGYQSGFTGIANSRNVLNGYQTGYSIGGSNYAFGGNDHVFVGYQAGYHSGSGDAEGVCNSNTFVGSSAGFNTNLGSSNSFVGMSAGINNSRGFKNTFIGTSSGLSNTDGYSNTILGFRADLGSSSLVNAAALGAEAIVVGDNEMILGNNDVSVGVGMSGTNIFNAKLEVFNDLTLPIPQRAAGYFHTDGNTNANETHGIYVTNTSSGGNRLIGGKFTGFGNATDSYGLLTSSSGGTNSNIGIAAGSSGGATYNYGIHASVALFGGLENYAGYFTASPTATGTNYGVYAEASNASVNNWAFWSNGNQFSTTNTIWAPSDIQFKNTIKPMKDVLEKINQLSPKTYLYNIDNPYGLNFPKEEQYGLIAQDLELVFPELVMKTYKPEVKDTSGKVVTKRVDFKAVNFNALIPILIKGIQEQSTTITQLEEEKNAQDSINRHLQNQIEMLVNQINSIKNTNGESLNNNSNSNTSITLENNSDVIYLGQNQPNPFNEKSIIKFSLPEIYNSAFIQFHDSNGKQIKNIELNTHGINEITVYAQNISSGIYSYSLIVDNKIIDTKKMIKN